MITAEQIINKSPEEITGLLNQIVAELRKQYDIQIDCLREQIRLLMQKRYGASSEKMKMAEEMGQGNLFAEHDFEPEINEATEDSTAISAHKRKKKRRDSLPDNLERVRKEYCLPENEQYCQHGNRMCCIGEVVSEELCIVPRQTYVLVHAKKKYACPPSCRCQAKNGDASLPMATIKVAVGPMRVMPKCFASPSLLSDIIVAKYMDSMPLYRQEHAFKRIGVELSRGTMSRWLVKLGEVLLMPLVNILADHIRDYDVAYADETRVQVLKDGPNPQSKSYMWVFLGGKPGKMAVIFQYHTGRSGAIPDAFFANYKGAIHCDGYPGYNFIAANDDQTRVGCLDHVRRKFIEACPSKKEKGIAGKAIKLIRRLYHIESEMKNEEATVDTIYSTRQEKSVPILTEIRALLNDSAPKVPPKSLIGEAIKYALNQWDYVINYVNDGRYEISNIRCERQIKPFAVGRKNWLFSQSVSGASASANLYSLMRTAIINDLNPNHYFTYLLKRLPHCATIEDYVALLPFNSLNSQLKTKDLEATGPPAQSG